jgi:hypothetical protein
MRHEVVDCMQLAEVRVRMRDILSTAMNILVLKR